MLGDAVAQEGVQLCPFVAEEEGGVAVGGLHHEGHRGGGAEQLLVALRVHVVDGGRYQGCLAVDEQRRQLETGAHEVFGVVGCKGRVAVF